MFVCCVSFSQETATVSLNWINQMISVIETQCLSCEMGSAFLKDIYTNARLQGLGHSYEVYSTVSNSDVTCLKLEQTQRGGMTPSFVDPEGSIAIFTKACQWSLTWARWSQCTLSHSISFGCILILSSLLHIHGLFFQLSTPTSWMHLSFTDACCMSCSYYRPCFVQKLYLVIW
jgi:hypothetical protein